MSDKTYGIGCVPYVPHFSTPVECLHFLFYAYYIQELWTNSHQLACPI